MIRVNRCWFHFMRERKHRTVRMNVLLDSPTVVVLRKWRCTLVQCAMGDLIEGVNDSWYQNWRKV
jgi:hypothetical protein